MKSLLSHKIFSVALSFLVMFSTLSLTIEKHFCGDVLIDVAIFTETEKCAMEAIEIEQEKITKISCCKDEIDVLDGINLIATTSFEDLDEIQKQLLLSYFNSCVNLLESLPNLVVPHKDYSQPLLIKDIQVLDEVYLI
ncbi:HYC_CC_PP family protein [Winogradskyella sp. MIT101101]|uniref:HYC_CC_PP family protein n=1 Tax=Winogradskyella sp. MIT101101 TaxID=3098297 RepID=UPI00399AA2FC